MARKRYKPEEIVTKLRQVDVVVSQGHGVSDAIRQIGVSEVTYYRWRREYGGPKPDQRTRVEPASLRCRSEQCSLGRPALARLEARSRGHERRGSSRPRKERGATATAPLSIARGRSHGAAVSAGRHLPLTAVPRSTTVASERLP